MTDLTKRVKRRTLAPHRGRRIIVDMRGASVEAVARLDAFVRRKRKKAANRKARR